MRWVLVPALLAAAPSVALAYGESDAEGRPSAGERRLHLLTNQVRADPHAFPSWDSGLATGEPRPPLVLEAGLSAAARFHADDMAANGCFSHESCDGTPFSQRIQRFFDGPAGENIAAGYPDAHAVMVGWMNSDGHRMNILRPGYDALGTGHASGNRWVQNFGIASAEPPRIVGGAAFPAGGRLRLAAHAFDPAGRAPERFEAVLGSDRVPLVPEVGAPGHRVWAAEVDAPTACASLHFELTDPGAGPHRFPTTGALRVGPGCTEDFLPGEGADDPRPVIDADEPAGGCRAAGSAPGRFAPLGILALGLGWTAARRKTAGAGSND